MIENGMKWARAGLISGVIASVAGNVANACLTVTSVSVLLRVPMAVVWPAFLFVAVEVLVRNRAARGWLARIGQGALLTITVPTAITSFVNLHALMIKAAEPGIAQLTGPLAIDGLMLGCTIMMLAARVVSTDTPDTAPVSVDTLDMSVPPPWTGEGVSTDIRWGDRDDDLFARLSNEMSGVSTPAVPVIPGPAPDMSAAPVSPAGPRLDNVPAEAANAIRAWDMSPVTVRADVMSFRRALAVETGRSDKTIRRWMSTVLS